MYNLYMIARVIRRVWRFLCRMDVVSALLAALLLLAILGACFPQRSTGWESSKVDKAQWEAGLRLRYGLLTDFLASIGAFHFFSSPLFIITLFLLTGSTLVCTLDRWRRVWRRAFHQEVCCPEATFEVADFSARLVGPALEDAWHVQDCLAARGLRVRSQETDSALYMRGDRNRLAPLATLLTHSGILLLILGAVLSAALGWREMLTVEPDQPSLVGNMAGTTLHYEDFHVERYPDGSAMTYQAMVRLTQDSQVMKRRGVRLNQPLGYRGVNIYLQGFELSGEKTSISLLVAHDPGYSLVVVAGFMLLFGMILSFNFPPVCVFARLEVDGTLCLAGRAGRRAYGFEDEFTALVAALESAGWSGVEGKGAPC